MGKEERLWEIDFLRGIAVLLMLLSNFVFDLSFFAYLQTANSLFWPLLAKVTAALFLLLVGVSLTLSLSRAGAKKTGFFKFFKRGISIFALGLIISIATWCAVGDDLVVFGILHLIGLGIILAYPFIKHPYISILASLVAFAGGWLASKFLVTFPWLIWLGVQYHGFSSVDYTPLLPWFGFILMGIFLGGVFFPGGKRRLTFIREPDIFLVWIIRKTGSRSLLIYFAHQPLFWSGFWVWQRFAV